MHYLSPATDVTLSTLRSPRARRRRAALLHTTR